MTLTYICLGYDNKVKLDLYEFYGYALFEFKRILSFGQAILEIKKLKMDPFLLHPVYFEPIFV